jgi:hypothetical protein
MQTVCGVACEYSQAQLSHRLCPEVRQDALTRLQTSFQRVPGPAASARGFSRISSEPFSPVCTPAASSSFPLLRFVQAHPLVSSLARHPLHRHHLPRGARQRRWPFALSNPISASAALATHIRPFRLAFVCSRSDPLKSIIIRLVTAML